MLSKMFGYRTVHKKIEEKIIQLSFIPNKYFEALYVECGTQIPCQTLDMCEMEEKKIRLELLKLMKEGEVDTKIELEKFQLFERINQVLTNAREIRSLMNTYGTEMMKKNYLQLLEILKNVSKAGKILHDCVRSLYENYNTALENVEKLTIECHEIIQKLFSFKFPNEIFHDNFFESPEVLIGESLRETLQNMITIGEKVISIIDKFSYNKYDKEDVSKIKKLLNTIKN